MIRRFTAVLTIFCKLPNILLFHSPVIVHSQIKGHRDMSSEFSVYFNDFFFLIFFVSNMFHYKVLDC